MTGEVMLTKDPITLAAANQYQYLFQPGFRNISDAMKSRNPHKRIMDKISMGHSAYLRISDDDNEPDADFVIVPLTFNITWLVKFRRGIKMAHGWTKEFKTEFHAADYGFEDCIPVARDQVLGGKRSGRRATMKTVSKLARKMCNLMPLAEKLFHSKFDGYIMSRLTLQGFAQGMLGQDNEYYPYPEMPMSTYALCSGMHVMDPDYEFVDNSFVVSAKIKREMWQSG